MTMPPFDIQIYGDALMSEGAFALGAYDGVGLLTQGLVWECRDIWSSGIGATVTTAGWTFASGTSLPATTGWTLYTNGYPLINSGDGEC